MESATFAKIKKLIDHEDVRVSEHGYQRLSAHEIEIVLLVDMISDAKVIEDYPDYHAGPAVLVLYFDRNNKPVHAVWGLEAGTNRPAVLVTAYRPAPEKWSNDFRTRKT